MRRYPGFLAALALALFSVSFSHAQSNDQKPDTAADAKVQTGSGGQGNPAKPTPESISEGKKIYSYDCALCHGVEGDGKGDLAGEMKLKLRDYRDPSSLKDDTDLDLFNVISKGKGEMPKEADRAETDKMWDLVNYVRSFAKKSVTASDTLPATATTSKP
jgi:mono/diheme cytochrome c family protein